MSVFTNSSRDATGNAQDYVRAILDLLGDRDPIEVLEELPVALAEQGSGLSSETLRQAEAPGKWSMAEVAQHLADAEVIWTYRLRLVLAEDRPRIPAFDQDQWAENLRYREADYVTAVEIIRVLRAASLPLIRSLSAADLRRVGFHAERGEQSVDQILRLQAGHDLVHRRQLQRIRATLGSR